MSQEEFLREFNSLLPEGKRLVANFVAFLQSRYAILESAKKMKRPNIEREKFIGRWRDSKDMKANSAWMLNLYECE